MSEMTDVQRRAEKLCNMTRKAKEQGLLLVKAATHNRQARHYGKFVLVDDKAGNRIKGAQAVFRAFDDGEGMTLDEVAKELAK